MFGYIFKRYQPAADMHCSIRALCIPFLSVCLGATPKRAMVRKSQSRGPYKNDKSEREKEEEREKAIPIAN